MFQQIGCLWELFYTPSFLISDITKIVDGGLSLVIDTIF